MLQFPLKKKPRTLHTKEIFKTYLHSPIDKEQQKPTNISSKRGSKSLFLTEFSKNKMNESPSPTKGNEVQPEGNMNNKNGIFKVCKNRVKTESCDPEINSWKDLNKLKNKYRVELLRRKSKDELFEENIEIIDRIENSAPKVDTWNRLQLFRSPRGSNENLLREKNKELVSKIINANPKIENWNKYKIPTSPREAERENNKFKIFEENMKIIERVEEASHRVKCWSDTKIIRTNQLQINRKEWKSKLLEENLSIIDKVESANPKVESWADLKSLKKNIELNRSKNSNAEKILKMKRVIQEAEKRLKSKQIEEEESSHYRRHKTMPHQISQRNSKAKQQQHEQSLKRLPQNIEKVNNNINCWGKPVKFISPIKIIPFNPSSRNSLSFREKGNIIGAAKESRQLRYMQRNMEMPSMLNKNSFS